MALTSSYTVEHAQADGRRWVVESHVDALLREHVRSYLASDTVNKDAVLAAYAVNLENSLKEGDYYKCLQLDSVSIEYASKTEIAAYFRIRYRDGPPDEVVRIARWIRRRIASGEFTVTQVRNAFGLTLTQWNTLAAKMAVMADALDVVEAAKGE